MDARCDRIGEGNWRRARLSGCSIVAVIVVCGAAAAQAQGKGRGSCADIPLAVTIGGLADPWSGGIYGDARDASGSLDPSQDATYPDGQPGVYAKFQVCNASYDFYLNLSVPDLKRSPRRFTVDFSTLLVPGDVAGYDGPVSAWLMKIPQMADLTRYAGDQLSALLVGTLESPGRFAYCNNDIASLDCTGKQLAIANKYSDLSVVHVTVAPGCSSWTVRPLAVVSAGDNANPAVDGYPVVGLIGEDTTTKPTQLVSGGQYNMPFTVTITRTDGAGCSGLPQ